MSSLPIGEECVHDAVLVCGGPRCPGGTALVDALRGAVRRTSSAVLVRTGCLGSCPAHPRGAPARARLQGTDAGLRPVPGSPGRDLAGTAEDLTSEAARWLLRADAPEIAGQATARGASSRQRRAARVTRRG